MKPICAHCERFMRCIKSGFIFLEGMPDGTVPPSMIRAGKHNLGWKPYKLWAGDLWECPECRAQTVIGALHPIAEHYQPDFAAAVERLDPKILVKDC